MLVLGNFIMLIGSILMVLCGYIKSAKRTILVQGFQMFLMGLGNIFLGSSTAAFMNFFAIIRNIVCYKGKLNNYWKVLFIIVSASVGLAINSLGFIGVLPILASGIFTLLMGVDNDSKLKKVIIFTNILWLIHDIFILSYFAAIFDILGIVTCIIALYRIKKEKNKK